MWPLLWPLHLLCIDQPCCSQMVALSSKWKIRHYRLNVTSLMMRKKTRVCNAAKNSWTWCLAKRVDSHCYQAGINTTINQEKYTTYIDWEKYSQVQATNSLICRPAEPLLPCAPCQLTASVLRLSGSRLSFRHFRNFHKMRQNFFAHSCQPSVWDQNGAKLFTASTFSWKPVVWI